MVVGGGLWGCLAFCAWGLGVWRRVVVGGCALWGREVYGCGPAVFGAVVVCVVWRGGGGRGVTPRPGEGISVGSSPTCQSAQ